MRLLNENELIVVSAGATKGEIIERSAYVGALMGALMTASFSLVVFFPLALFDKTIFLTVVGTCATAGAGLLRGIATGIPLAFIFGDDSK